MSQNNKTKIFNFLMEILLLVVVFVIPIIFDRRLGIVFSGTKVAWMRFFGVLMLGLWAAKLVVFRQHRFVRTVLDWPVAAFIFCTTIATITSVHFYTSFVGFYGRYEGLTSWYLFALFFFVVTNYFHSLPQLKRIVMTVVSASTLMAIYSVIQRHELDPYMWGGVVTWQRVIGTIGQPNFMAAYMLMAFFLILAVLLIDKSRSEVKFCWDEQVSPLAAFVFTQIGFLFMIYNLEAWHVVPWYFGFGLITVSALWFAYNYERLNHQVLNILLGFSFVMVYTAILYTQSRGGYMGFFTGVALFVLVAGRKLILYNWKKIFVLSSLIVIISGITMMRPEFSPFTRFTGEISSEKQLEQGRTKVKLKFHGAAGSRGETWKSAFGIIADYPLFGIGPEVLKMVFPRYETDLFRFKEAFHVKQDRCHNETFDVAVTKGLLAFAAFLWIIIAVFRHGIVVAAQTESSVKRLLLAGLLAASLAYLIQNQFSFGVVAIVSLFWIIWAMILKIGQAEAQDDDGQALNLNEIPWLLVAVIVVFVGGLSYLSFLSFRADVHFKSGKTFMQMRRLPQAIAAFEQSLAILPHEGGVVSHLGIASLNHSQTSREPKERLKYLQQALKTFQYGTQIDPYNADNFYILAKINLMLGQTKLSEELAIKALKIDPYYAEVYFTLGLLYEKQKKLDLAAKHYEKAFFINPYLSGPMDRLKAINQQRGKADLTWQVFERAREKYGWNLLILERVTRNYLERGLFKKALVVAEEMIIEDQKNITGYLLRAESNLNLGAAQKASIDVQQVLIEDPKNIAAHNLLGRIYLAQGEKLRAREEFLQVLQLDANNDLAKKQLKKL